MNNNPSREATLVFARKVAKWTLFTSEAVRNLEQGVIVIAFKADPVTVAKLDVSLTGLQRAFSRHLL